MRFHLIIIFSVAEALFCIANDSDRTKQEFQRLESQWVEALEKHDVGALDRLLADDFIDSTFRGAIRDKKSILAGPRTAAAYRSKSFEDFQVRVYGSDTAIVTAINVLQGSAPNDVVRVRFTDVFIKLHGQWRAVSAQETLQANS